MIDPAAAAADGAPRLRAMATAYLAYLDSDAYSGGCFWAATSAEYDDRPGPVRDAIAGAIDAWLGELERQARDRRRRRPRAPRLRALRGRDGRQLALPPQRRPARLRLREGLGAAAARRAARVSAEADGEQRAADFAQRFPEFWKAPSPARLDTLLAERVRLGRADDADDRAPARRGNGSSRAC